MSSWQYETGILSISHQN